MVGARLNKLSFNFIPEDIGRIGSDDDHIYITIPDQIEILIDGKNLLDDYGFGFGMFPLDFFSQDKHFFDGKLQVGVCGCSCYGCCDLHVDVNSTNDMVVWSTGPYVNRTEYIFDKNEYTETINKFTEKYVNSESYSKISEIISNELRNTEIETGYVYSMFRFYWYGKTIILCFETEEEETEENCYRRWNGETEKNYHIDWNGNIENLIEEIIKFKREIYE